MDSKRIDLIKLVEECEISYAISNKDFFRRISNNYFQIVFRFDKKPPIQRILIYIIKAEEIIGRFPLVDFTINGEHRYYYPDYDERPREIIIKDLVSFIKSNSKEFEEFYVSF